MKRPTGCSHCATCFVAYKSYTFLCSVHISALQRFHHVAIVLYVKSKSPTFLHLCNKEDAPEPVVYDIVKSSATKGLV